MCHYIAIYWHMGATIWQYSGTHASVLTVAPKFPAGLSYVSKAHSLTGVSNHAFDITRLETRLHMTLLYI